MVRYILFLACLLCLTRNVALASESAQGLKVKLHGEGAYTSWDPTVPLPKGSRAITSSQGVKLLLPSGVQLELGKDSVLSVMESSETGSSLWLTRGRLRVITEHQNVKVQTPSCDIQLTHGKSDVIIANLNTLCIGREGNGLTVKSKLDLKNVPVEHYVLATPQGALIVKALERNNTMDPEDPEKKDDLTTFENSGNQKT